MTSYVVTVVSCAILVLLWALSRKGATGAVLPSAIGGIASLFAVQLTGFMGALTLSMNLFTVGVAVFMGIPGVVGLLLLRLVAVI